MTKNNKPDKLNKNPRGNKLFFRLFFCVVIVLLFFVFLFNGKTKKNLRVSFFDVGQGDSALIQTPDGQIILIDGGPDNLTLRRLGEKLPFYQREIDLIIISHYHHDHITGLIEIMRRYRVKKIIYGPEIKDSYLFNILSLIAQENNSEFISVFKQAQIRLDEDCFIWFFNPLSLKIKPAENNSLITKLDCYQQKFLFSGDNESAVELALLTAGLNLQADIFKSSHHGSKTSNTLGFLKMINPSKIIISVGADNRFEHPSTEVLKNVNWLGIKVFRTDLMGTIDIFSNIK